MSEIYLLGISDARLTPLHLDCIRRCTAVVASSRHRPLVESPGMRILPIAPVRDMLAGLEAELEQGNVALLASGDPLFFGIGRTLLDRFAPERIHIIPALSSMQAACAALREPWDDLHWLSLHGRERSRLPGLLLRHPKTLVLTDHRNSPESLAGELLEDLRALGAKEMIEGLELAVVEHAGLSEERVTRGDLGTIAGGEFSPLNVLLLKKPMGPPPPRLGLGESDFRYSRGLITKNEVRSAILHRLCLPREGLFWDIGSGSGSVAVSAGILNPGLEVVAVERHPEQLANIQANIRRWGGWNVRPVAGSAPEALGDLPDPDRIFVGGSGGKLEPILRCCAERLGPGGRLVVSAVLERTALQAPQILNETGMTMDIVRIAVSRSSRPDEALQPLNPITLITAWK